MMGTLQKALQVMGLEKWDASKHPRDAKGRFIGSGQVGFASAADVAEVKPSPAAKPRRPRAAKPTRKPASEFERHFPQAPRARRPKTPRHANFHITAKAGTLQKALAVMGLVL